MPTYTVLSFSTPNFHIAAVGLAHPSEPFTYHTLVNVVGHDVPAVQVSAFDVEDALFRRLNELAMSNALSDWPKPAASDMLLAFTYLRTFRHTDPVYPKGIRYTSV